MKRLAFLSLVALLTLCGLYLVYVFRAVVIIFILSLFTASALRPLITRLTERGIPATLSIVVTYLVSVLLLGGWLYAVGHFAIDELADLADRVVSEYQVLQQTWGSGNMLQQSIAGRLPPSQAILEALTAEEGTLLAQALLSIVGAIASVVAAIVIIIVLGIYWNADRIRFEGLWLSLLPASQRGRVRRAWDQVEDGVGDYLRSQGVQLFLAVILLAAGYALMGIDYPVLLGIVGAVAWLIPVLGFMFAALAALLVGLIHSAGIGALAALYTVVIFLVLHNVVERTFLHYERDFSFLLVTLLAIPLAETYGFFGLLAAPPLAVSIESLLTILFDSRRSEATADDPQTRLAELENQLQNLKQRASEADRPLPPEISSLMKRLDQLMARTTSALDR